MELLDLDPDPPTVPASYTGRSVASSTSKV